MTSTMVTVRMDESKKLRGNAILKKSGKTPSDAINELYDIIIKENALPWKKERSGIATMSAGDVAEAKDFLQSIQVVNSRFSTMSDEEIRSERMQLRGIA